MLIHNSLLAVRISRDESAALRKVEALLGPGCDCDNAVLRISDRACARMVVVKMRSCLRRRGRFLQLLPSWAAASPADAAVAVRQPSTRAREPDRRIRRRRV